MDRTVVGWGGVLCRNRNADRCIGADAGRWVDIVLTTFASSHSTFTFSVK